MLNVTSRGSFPVFGEAISVISAICNPLVALWETSFNQSQVAGISTVKNTFVWK